ncbi:2Fe-2S iron-sulfur cluster-binding protein [Phaeobacter inhibens]|uniref:2Fe-2S iron-sulfur cluster-binding protein n=1 Tax=Phaeobacter inhibens TaxID=221822 RepID=UPI0021A4FEF2|nr:2Fe-2S iron-sulfur cluster-binding protein [Phaeobacter inhibens]UWR44165.1 2Fe-2S iron-sulfur cluster binding domain-containing protein [Phaeobacter inhibens]
MTSSNPLSVLAGYDAAQAKQAELAQSGTDFTKDRFATAKQIAALHPKRLNLTVRRIIRETGTAVTLRLTRSDGEMLPPFQAGQYVNLFVTVDGTQTARPFAISSPPQIRTHYDITVREVPGGFVSPYLVRGLTEGQLLQSSGPMGTFYHNPLFHGDDLVFLAGGSGVAPAMSMIHNFLSSARPPQFHLIYGSRNTGDVIFREQLHQLADRHETLTVDEVISEPDADYSGHSGFLNADLIAKLVGPLEAKTFYLCGPNAMYDFCQPELTKLGVSERKVHVEANGPPPVPNLLGGWPADVTLDQEVTVTVRGRGSFRTSAGEPLLNALERNGFQVENACRSGECSLCRIKILSGEVFNPPQSRLRSSDRAFGWTHACVAYPAGDIEILI